jgi:hypothetical protein
MIGEATPLTMLLFLLYHDMLSDTSVYQTEDSVSEVIACHIS